MNLSSLPVAKPGVSTVMLSDPGIVPGLPTDWRTEGAFRLLCNWSKMSFDDPIVYPGKPGAAHHHTFFGNTGIDANTTVGNIRTKGNASCRGGTINLSGYWSPSMIDEGGKPLPPRYMIVYYKTGAWPWMGDRTTNLIQPLPAGLRMITGSAARSTPGGRGHFACIAPDGSYRDGTKGSAIPTCPQGDLVRFSIPFSQCWDGINLDSPDHQSHMADPTTDYPDPYSPYRCPSTHPVVLPLITMNVDYEIPTGANTGKWRLSSDTYDASQPGGYSQHADWMNGWDPAISALWGIKCMRDRRECGAANLGDGRTTLEFQGN